MHRQATVCTVSNMQAGDYCPVEYIDNRGATVIPKGHPLYDYTRSHASVIRQYLGPFAAIGGDSGDSGSIDRAICDIHTADWALYQQQAQSQDELAAQAQALVNDAYNRAGAAGEMLDPAVNQLIHSAISAVEAVLYSGNIDANTLQNAMQNLRDMMVLLP